MHVHITGNKGFIGWHLARRLADRNHHVTGSDIDHALAPRAIFDTVGEPDLVVLAGALVGKRAVREAPRIACNLNVGSVTAWAEELAERRIRALYISTSEVYGQHERVAWESQRVLTPASLYGLTKLWGEQALAHYLPRRAYAIARLSMPYGPGLKPGPGRAALANMIYAAARGLPLKVHAGAVRSFCWIGDIIDALVLLIEEGKYGIWNVGRDDDPRTMMSVAELIVELIGSDSSIAVTAPAPDQVLVKRLSTEKIRLAGWRPAVPLRQGLAAYHAWMMEEYPLGQPHLTDLWVR
jgi:nucleoside-diphosphate-sugar epimerase